MVNRKEEQVTPIWIVTVQRYSLPSIQVIPAVGLALFLRLTFVKSRYKKMKVVQKLMPIWCKIYCFITCTFEL